VLRDVAANVVADLLKEPGWDFGQIRHDALIEDLPLLSRWRAGRDLALTWLGRPKGDAKLGESFVVGRYRPRKRLRRGRQRCG
jgi:hypothetical protein